MIRTMHFTAFESPIGLITLTAAEHELSGLYNDSQKHWPTDSATWLRDDGARFDTAREWLTNYFAGRFTAALPKIHFASGTVFQQQVWRALLSIRVGQTISYAELAQAINAPKAVRAVGAAVGRNPISIIVPCHRVVGSNRSLTGYAGGLERKRWLLKHEGVALD
jgi:methylated-DNA-[protein]-cysteine S-methyltransferase